MSECLFIFGMGYSGLLLANEMIARGWTVSGTCREENKRKLLEDMGIKAYLFHKNHPLSLAQQVLADTTHLISTIPPDTNGDPVLGLHAKNLSDLPNVKWAGYISTTGVYGDRGGDWVDEDTVAEPTGERGKLRVLAEEKWFSLLRSGLPLHVFRTAGIYGPARNPFTKLRSGTATRVDKPGHVFSRIHVNDLINIICASIEKPMPGRIYNACDDEPASSAEVIEYAAKLLGIKPPPLIPLEEAKLSQMARSFYSESKRVKNMRIKDELGVSLLYPNYRIGLANILKDEINS